MQLSELLRTLILGTIGDPASSQELIDAITTGANAIPSQTGQNGKVLSTDGTNTEWITTSGLGDVMGGGNLTTVGSIPYVSASGTVTQTNNLFWDNTNKRMTIGNGGVNNNTPARGQIYVVAQDANGSIFTELAGASGSGTLTMRRALGSPASPTALGVLSQIGAINAQGWDGSGSFSGAAAAIRFLSAPSASNWTVSDHGASTFIDATQSGTTTKKAVAAFSLGPTGKSVLGIIGTDQTHQLSMVWDGGTNVNWGFPSTQGGANTFLRNDGTGTLSWVSAGGAATDLSNLTLTTAINSTLFQFASNGPVIAGNDVIGHPGNNISLRGGQRNNADGGDVNIIGGSPNGVGSLGGGVNITRGTGGNSNGTVTINSITYPDTDGTSGQVLATNGSAVLSFIDVANNTLSNLGSTAINTSLIPDDENAYALGGASREWSRIYVRSIQTGGGVELVLAPGNGNVNLQDSNIININQLSLRASGQTTTITAGAGAYSLVLPPAQGAAGTSIFNDGSGNLRFKSAGSFTKYTKTFTDFSDASTSKTITLVTVPAKTMISRVIIRPTTQFTGGALDAYFISIGKTGSETAFISNYNVFVANTPDDGGGTPISMPNAIVDFDNPYDVVVQATSSSDNLNAATQGSVDIWVETVNL